MGMVIEGKWVDDDVQYRAASNGAFVLPQSVFTHRVTTDGSSGFKAEPGRYHLYVSYACPWAHRTLILRALKRLEGVISVSVVHHFMGADGWTFRAEDGATGDTLNGFDFLHQNSGFPCVANG